MAMKVAANMAPEKPPENLPDGWCKGGQPTRTTGECVCISGKCKGEGCIHSALVFYKYSTCPTCECVKVENGSSLLEPDGMRRDTYAKEQDKEQKSRSVSAEGVPVALDPHSSLQFGSSQPAGDEHPSYEEWLEENSRIMAAAVVTVFFVIIIGAHIYSKVCGSEGGQAAAKTN